MTEPFNYDHPAYEDQRRKDARKAHLEASAAGSTPEALEEYRAIHDHLTRSQHGIMGAITPQQAAAEVAARPPVVGGDCGGRPLERQGGTFNWSDFSDSPAPAMVDRRWVDRPGMRPTGKSPGQRWLEENR